MYQSISRYFADPRLRQLFARYATYCGSSPFDSPATLMLIAHVEQAGVWTIEGGMHRLAQSLAKLATNLGADLRYGTAVSRVDLERGRVAAVETASAMPITMPWRSDCSARAYARASRPFRQPRAHCPP
jgi:1-hydroxycarotenoid 3,4-desaturase